MEIMLIYAETYSLRPPMLHQPITYVMAIACLMFGFGNGIFRLIGFIGIVAFILYIARNSLSYSSYAG